MPNDEKQDEKPKRTAKDVADHLRALVASGSDATIVQEDALLLADAHDDLQWKLTSAHAGLDAATRELLELRARFANGDAHDTAAVLREKRRARDAEMYGRPELRPGPGE